jgi:hypothetical protein
MREILRKPEAMDATARIGRFTAHAARIRSFGQAGAGQGGIAQRSSCVQTGAARGKREFRLLQAKKNRPA